MGELLVYILAQPPQYQFYMAKVPYILGPEKAGLFVCLFLIKYPKCLFYLFYVFFPLSMGALRCVALAGLLLA